MQMNMVRPIAALALACSGTGALATDWRAVTSDAHAISYVDADSVRRDGERIDFTVTIVFVGPPLRRALARYEGDCAQMAARPVQFTAFRSDGTSGDVLMNGEVRRAEPGTNLHVALDAACRRRFAGPTVPDVEAHAVAAAPRARAK